MTSTVVPLESVARTRLIAAISRQLTGMVSSVADDVAQNRDAESGVPGGGFLAYSLTNDDGALLKSTHANDHSVSVEDMQSTIGWSTLASHCDRLQLRLRVEEHYYTDEPELTKIYRVVIDGWE